MIEDDPTLPDAEQPLFDVDPDDVPRVLGGRYTLEERLGVGGRSVVWRAHDAVLGRTVAIKVLRPATGGPDADAARLRREASTAGRAAHSGIVAVYDTGVDDGLAWIALEHVDGPTLLEILRHHPSGMEPAVAAAVAEQVAEALGHAHARGLVHRDVKPANLLLTAEGLVKLADFGVAAVADDGEPAERAGSRGYAPPEQLAGHPGAEAPTADVFALGVVLHECLTGQPAFTTRSRRATEAVLSPRQVDPSVPRDLDEVVRRATRREPADRHPTGTALAVALRPLVSADPLALTRTLVDGWREVRDGAGRDDGAAGDHGDDGPHGIRPWVVLTALFAVIAAGLLLAQLVDTTGASTATPSEVADAGVPVSHVELFDPYGSVGRGGTTPLAAVDGDAATAWRTPDYPVPLRSLGTPGIGIWIDVGQPRSIEAVEVALGTGGITVELLAADVPPTAGTTEADWRSLDRAVRPGPAVDLAAQGTEARYWLLWVTELEPVGETWQSAVTDLRFRAVPETP